MSRPIGIAPSIVAADFGHLAEAIRQVEQAGAEVLHVDVMDGRYVPNISVGTIFVSALRRLTTLPLDVHLMVEDPDRHVDAFIEAGADLLTVHLETTPHLHRTLRHIRGFGRRAGVALNPTTPEDRLRYVIDELDLVLVMTVDPGSSGQSLLPSVLPKIAAVRALLDAHGVAARLEVDGGIHRGTVGSVVGAGADLLVAGSAIYDSPDPTAAVEEIRRLAFLG